MLALVRATFYLAFLSVLLLPLSQSHADDAQALSVTFADAAPPQDIALDANDVDENGVLDGVQAQHIPVEHTLFFKVRNATKISVTGPARLIENENAIASPHTIAQRSAHELSFGIQGVPNAGIARVTLRVENGPEIREFPFNVVAASFLDANNAPIDPRHEAVGLSHQITNDATLPRGSEYAQTSPDDRDNLRAEYFSPTSNALEENVRIESVDATTNSIRGALVLNVRRANTNEPFRSNFFRLVGDAMDAHAPGVLDRVLVVGLRDRIRIVRRGVSLLSIAEIRVGRPGDENGERATRAATLRVHVMRMTPGGPAVIGTNDADAIRIGRDQVTIANEIWLQCYLGFGRPEDAVVTLEDPPPASMFTIANEDGLFARGGGTIALRIGTSSIRVTTRPFETPAETGLDLASAITRAGFVPRVVANSRTDFGASGSVDIVVRTRTGALTTITRDGDAPLTTDAQQTITIGGVDLRDGVGEFNNMNASAGTMEERTIIRELSDDDPTSVDIFIVSSFTHATRIGESFVKGDGSATVNALILDRAGIRQQRAAWTQSHELGHILLDVPFHPDNVGPDRPWLLMDADNSSATVAGPKRLSWDECHRLEEQSGPNASPALLRRGDARTHTPEVTDHSIFPGYSR